MPPPPAQTFTLTPHPADPGETVRGIRGRVSRMPDGMLMVTYILEGDLDRVRVPARQPPRFADDLWRHTCCEMFIARTGQPAYHEINFSPSGEWAVYAFERLRQRVPLGTGVEMEELKPHVTVCRTEGKLELDAVMRLDRVSPTYAGSKLVLGLSAVIEDQEGSLSYWALKHPLAKPDFHHPDAFALELDEVRN